MTQSKSVDVVGDRILNKEITRFIDRLSAYDGEDYWRDIVEASDLYHRTMTAVLIDDEALGFILVDDAGDAWVFYEVRGKDLWEIACAGKPVHYWDSEQMETAGCADCRIQEQLEKISPGIFQDSPRVVKGDNDPRFWAQFSKELSKIFAEAVDLVCGIERLQGIYEPSSRRDSCIRHSSSI